MAAASLSSLDQLAAGMRRGVRRVGKRAILPVTHAVGRATRRYYFEDFVRVYPGGIAYNRLGIRHRARADELKIFRNHVRVYEFAAQLVAGKRVADVGCGAGYGCKILHDAGAREVHGCDISRHALRFARRRFGACAEFTRQTIVDLTDYGDDSFDIVFSSEVLEHIKEYGLAGAALAELRRIVRPGGLLIVGTPNSELLGEHGFSFDEISALFAGQVHELLVFENALVPFEAAARDAWRERAATGRTGVVVSERVAVEEIPVPPGKVVETKRGEEPGTRTLGGYTFNTGLLHNTHGWIVLAVEPERGDA
ncbi:MAG: hypothetical protein V7644_189 [Actinomycetota bacterium]